MKNEGRGNYKSRYGVMNMYRKALLLMLLCLSIVGCQNIENRELKWGEPANLETFIISTLDARVTGEHESFYIVPNNKLMEISILIENHSTERQVIDHDFYSRFGVSVDNSSILARMGSEFLYPYKDLNIYFGEIEAEETVETNLYFFTTEGKQYILLYGEDSTKANYEASWTFKVGELLLPAFQILMIRLPITREEQLGATPSCSFLVF